MFENYSDIMSVDQVAEALGIGLNSAYTLVNSHEIYSKRVGRKILIPKTSVIDFILSPEHNRQAAVREEAHYDS